jgi:hypothetical protein
MAASKALLMHYSEALHQRVFSGMCLGSMHPYAAAFRIIED